jgi:fucose permease
MMWRLHNNFYLELGLMTEFFTSKGRFTLGLSFACFVALGIGNGLLGVAWPSIRAAFGLPLDALVALLISSTVGFVFGSVTAGQLMARLTIGRFLLLTNLLAVAGFIGYAVAPGWWILVACGVLTGWGAGAIDTGLNIYVAATSTVRIMNWMHAMFGVGATIGPLIMTTVVGLGIGWRFGYVIAALVHLTLGLLLIPVLKQMSFRGMTYDPATHGDPRHPEPALATFRLPIVLLSILLFLLYTGVESTTGQWSFTLFTEARGISTYLAGIMTSLFWAMLTLGRILFGAAADRIGVQRLLRLSMAGAVFSAALFLLRSPAASFVSVGLMGLSLAAIFPTLTSDTPQRAGPAHAANAIGYQTGAASIGFAILPGVAGVLAARLGLEVLGPYLVITSALMVMTNEITIRLVARNNRHAILREAGVTLE